MPLDKNENMEGIRVLDLEAALKNLARTDALTDDQRAELERFGERLEATSIKMKSAAHALGQEYDGFSSWLHDPQGESRES